MTRAELIAKGPAHRRRARPPTPIGRRNAMTEKDMADNVVPFNGMTRLDVPAERILQKAIEAGLDKVVVMGWDSDGDLYTASSMADGGEVLWVMELTKRRLMDIAEDIAE